MSRGPLPYSRVTLYQVEGDCDPEVLLKSLYTDRVEFDSDIVTVEGRTCYWVRGVVSKDRVSWADLVRGWLGDQQYVEGLGNSTAAGVLLIPTLESEPPFTWAICFGMGHHLVEPSRIVQDLGRRIAVRCADPEQVRQVTYSKLDVRAMVARVTSPSGDSIDGFGASDIGDFISRVVGPAVLEGVVASSGGESTEIRGADSINLPLARTTTELISDLDQIEVLLRRDPQPQLALIEQLKLIKRSDPVYHVLEERLDEALGNPDSETLGLAWPTELAEEAVPFASFAVSGLPQHLGGDFESDRVDLGSLLAPIRRVPSGSRVLRLKSMRVLALTSEGEAAASTFTGPKWLIFETVVDGRRYCMHEGSWYRVDEGLNERVSERLAPVFARAAPITELPQWPEDMDEGDYNELLAEAVGGVCLDKQLVQCETSPKGFESCDVFLPNGADRSPIAGPLTMRVTAGVG